MLVALVLCLVGIVAAQRPIPCTTPSQWEGNVYDVNEEQKFRLNGRLSYDAVYHRERIAEDIEEGSQDDFFERLALFESQIEFVYNFRARNCTRQPITRQWRDFGIRPTDTSYGEAYIGSSAFPDTGLLVTIWGGNFTLPTNDTIDYTSTWTYRGCIPVTRTSFSPKFGISHLSFYDVTAGIRDPNVFIPRRECLSSEEWASRYTLFGTPAKKHI
ncbi:unnamed protein product [Rotaria socialis]|uniref:Mammalian ependymin-related protein 1 n=1 Tax=Rotaria socialis TaxID=392032 RepID=A0A817RVG8_9BILA|nr:unnamed protein product [Rotaria socialis]CAF3312390.1 unnamed protein product [Rotaria socialis]CAF3335976.1 unnamed protein product [Rotaria socialis]CAF3343364.1 unnamed protein product [Rotaria socialis]CAF3558121.1 unnamed protein product [Rotaria socialis]